MDSAIARLEGLGAVLADGPIATDDGRKIAFIKAPDDIRIRFSRVSSRGAMQGPRAVPATPVNRTSPSPALQS